MQWRWKTVNSTPRSKVRTGRSHARIARRRWIPVVEVFEDRTLLSLSVGTSFTGGVFSQSGFIPPDTQGAAGPTQLVETINGEYSVYSKTGSVVDPDLARLLLQHRPGRRRWRQRDGLFV